MPDATPQNPYLFIVGCPRSGTTLLQRMVDAHPKVAVIFEGHWVPRLFERRAGMTADGRVTPDLLSRLLEEPRFQRLEIDPEPLRRLIEGNGGLSYAAFVSAVFDLYGERRGKPIVGEKTPDYVRNIELLHGLWPWARFLHIVRDGRDVCLSMLEWRPERFARRFPTWSEDPIATAAVYWAWLAEQGREAGQRVGAERYREIRYEALVDDPRRECEEVCRFLGVPYDDAMPRFHEGRERPAPGRDAKKAWLPATGGLRDWTTQMTPEEVDRFEAAAGGVLADFGYPRAVERPSARSAAQAMRITEGFCRYLDAKRWPYSRSVSPRARATSSRAAAPPAREPRP